MRCPACDTPNPPEAVRCEECGKKLPPRKRASQPDMPDMEEDIEESESRPRRRVAEDEDEDVEEYEPRRRRRSVRRADEGDEVVSTIIPYKNPKALAGYYCGIFSLFPILGFILGPLALTLGIMGLRYVKRKPQAHGTVHAIIAIIGGIFGTLISLSCGIILIAMWKTKGF
ncbi:MAG TPA: zinc ribbon domain-containing protein [Gemmataceae bacterium]|jgi:hypothetical protein|nr:zinc ribbon domain-containing protein [Gemmataceae bacterium]